jgi:hypothetical protein
MRLLFRQVVAGDALEEEENSVVAGKFGGPCRGRTYGSLIKSSAQSQSEQTPHDLTLQQTEDSEKSLP